MVGMREQMNALYQGQMFLPREKVIMSTRESVVIPKRAALGEEPV
jgi:hypothetical protein